MFSVRETMYRHYLYLNKFQILYLFCEIPKWFGFSFSLIIFTSLIVPFTSASKLLTSLFIQHVLRQFPSPFIISQRMKSCKPRVSIHLSIMMHLWNRLKNFPAWLYHFLLLQTATTRQQIKCFRKWNSTDEVNLIFPGCRWANEPENEKKCKRKVHRSFGSKKKQLPSAQCAKFSREL